MGEEAVWLGRAARPCPEGLPQPSVKEGKVWVEQQLGGYKKFYPLGGNTPRFVKNFDATW